MSVILETTIGDITVDLFLKQRPHTCQNFLKLCKIKYYNLCLFHKVERNFIAQTGDPTGTGRGGESVFCHLYGEQAKYFEAELKPRLKHQKVGTLSMVNNGNNMNGSQFFLTLSENVTYLDEMHTVFGEVTEGFDILQKLNEAICDPNSRPYQDIRITHTVVLHDPFDDPDGLEIPDSSPIPTNEMLQSDYIAADEEIDDTKGKTVEEIEEKIKTSEAKARATILEMVGDIPDADVKPPENVLFVCKLNPVTSSEDLETIFRRFGPIISCEVIKDRKSGESLQYAFIEFEKEEDCENAYFKMDNVLIDDRRIHVDFSQSVSKMNWEMNKEGGNKPSTKQNLVLKKHNKSADGYDMIFDMDESGSVGKSKSQKSRIDYEKSSYNKTDRQHLSYPNDRNRDRHYKSYQSHKNHEDKKYHSSHYDSYTDNLSQPSTKDYHSKYYDKQRNEKRSPDPNLYKKSKKYDELNIRHETSYKREFSKSKRHDSSSSESNSPIPESSNYMKNHYIKTDIHRKRKNSSSSSRSKSPAPKSLHDTKVKKHKSHSYEEKYQKRYRSRERSPIDDFNANGKAFHNSRLKSPSHIYSSKYDRDMKEPKSKTQKYSKENFSDHQKHFSTSFDRNPNHKSANPKHKNSYEIATSDSSEEEKSATRKKSSKNKSMKHHRSSASSDDTSGKNKVKGVKQKSKKERKLPSDTDSDSSSDVKRKSKSERKDKVHSSNRDFYKDIKYKSTNNESDSNISENSSEKQAHYYKKKKTHSKSAYNDIQYQSKKERSRHTYKKQKHY